MHKHTDTLCVPANCLMPLTLYFLSSSSSLASTKTDARFVFTGFSLYFSLIFLFEFSVGCSLKFTVVVPCWLSPDCVAVVLYPQCDNHIMDGYVLSCSHTTILSFMSTNTIRIRAHSDTGRHHLQHPNHLIVKTKSIKRITVFFFALLAFFRFCRVFSLLVYSVTRYHRPFSTTQKLAQWWQRFSRFIIFVAFWIFNDFTTWMELELSLFGWASAFIRLIYWDVGEYRFQSKLNSARGIRCGSHLAGCVLEAAIERRWVDSSRCFWHWQIGCY